MSEETSARVATIAARGIKHPEGLTLGEIRTVCASALTQRPAMTAADLDRWLADLTPTQVKVAMDAIERAKAGL